MNRRQFFQYSAAVGGAISLPAFALEKQILALTIVSGITPATSVGGLRAVLQGLIFSGLPVTCVVHTQTQDGEDLRYDSDLARMLRKFLQETPGLIEIVGFADGLGAQAAHFQARTAFKVKSQLVEALALNRASNAPSGFFQSLACTAIPQMSAPTGVRTAGFRNVLAISGENQPVVPKIWDNGTLRVFGGTYTDVFSPEALGIRSDGQYHKISILNAVDFVTVPDSKLTAAAIEFADAAARFEGIERVSNQRLADLQLRDNYGFQRVVSLHLFEPLPGNADELQGFEAFKSDLRRINIPFSSGVSIHTNPGAKSGSGYWLATENELSVDTGDNQSGAEQSFEFECKYQATKVSRTSSRDLVAGIGLTANEADKGLQGVDACGHLRLPIVSASELLQSGPTRQRLLNSTLDMIVAVSPDLTTTGAQRRAILRMLDGFTKDWISKFVPVQTFAQTILPKSPLISLYRNTEAAANKIAPDTRALDSGLRQIYQEDAKVAWRYFSRFTNPTTGLCPATVNFSPGGKRLHETVTMWDVGSQILALIAAMDIGLMSKKDFHRSISKIMPNIAGRRTQGRLLPQGWIRTDKHRWGNANFDGCDAGRLLAALYNLKKHKAFTEITTDLVASWDLDKVIVEKEIQSVLKGEFKSTYSSQCAHYSAVGFRLWGLDVASPYEVTTPMSDCDRKMKVLESVSSISPIGAEPLLLDALEFGLTPDTAYLADVLFAAQLEEYEKTGVLVCASEGPIDHEPWFTYQGLKFDAVENRWIIDTVGREAKYKTPEFQTANQVISVKASYLWAAYNPHSYSNRLVDFVRSTAKTKNGFASSIYSTTGRPTQNYSDLNTNGIILQSIARILASDPAP